VTRPGHLKLVVENFLGNAEVAFAAEPGECNIADVEEGAEKCAEEKHFGCNEPQHSHPERDADLRVITATQVFPDNIPKPTEQQIREQQQSGNDKQRTDRYTVHGKRRAKQRGQQ